VIEPAALRRLAGNLPENGELSYRDRRELRAELAPDALLRLETRCARHALPVWAAASGPDEAPASLMDDALRAPDQPGLDRRLAELKTMLDNLFERGEEFFPAIYAGFACWAVARNATGHRPPEPDVTGELEIDPMSWTPCFLASLAHAGGAVWEDTGDPRRRREYWTWYLLEAVPAAQTG
jgi:Immunity protein Imm5